MWRGMRCCKSLRDNYSAGSAICSHLSPSWGHDGRLPLNRQPTKPFNYLQSQPENSLYSENLILPEGPAEHPAVGATVVPRSKITQWSAHGRD
eukprot:scaffold232990_cov31-Prasinocladus_malaysianus.AAC.2